LKFEVFPFPYKEIKIIIWMTLFPRIFWENRRFLVHGFRCERTDNIELYNINRFIVINEPDFDMNISAVLMFLAIKFGPNVEILLAFDIEYTDKLYKFRNVD